MSEQIFYYLMIALSISGLAIIAIAFFNQANQETEFEIKLWDKFQLKLRTKKNDLNT
ncbi:hypothetical protein Xen7305DRAFT_00028360 [Xenococcus sp. PCC 7305]|uniref:hypothetical protein n=1 Tax=Xenococcus sp. PCC 7305 TaxID=102125 RepID=UPI0002AC446A|nr:hypothetical protein [Xenococcus sp. PCC 7305]ELS03116.1 hypothetical protein Xen7305DRAFT_00028360 [Xenococcus sp. PCC 7305]